MGWFLDGLALSYILFNGVIGYNRGLVDELGRLFTLVLSILIATSKTVYFSNLILKSMSIEPWLSTLIAFCLIFSTVLIFGRILTRLFKIALLSKSNIWMNNILGFFFASIKGYCIISVFFWIISILPLDKWTIIIEQNSKVVQTTNYFRISIISFFGWEDPVFYSANFLRKLVQP